jgi:hypothetical protein
MIMFLGGGIETLTFAVLEESKSMTFFPILLCRMVFTSSQSFASSAVRSVACD